MFSATRTAYTFNGMQPWPEFLSPSAKSRSHFPLQSPDDSLCAALTSKLATTMRTPAVSYSIRLASGRGAFRRATFKRAHATSSAYLRLVAVRRIEDGFVVRWPVVEAGRQHLVTALLLNIVNHIVSALLHNLKRLTRVPVRSLGQRLCNWMPIPEWFANGTGIHLWLTATKATKCFGRRHSKTGTRRQHLTTALLISVINRIIPCPALPPYPLPTYYDSAEMLVQSLQRCKNKHITGEILYVTRHGANCLGFFPLPDCPQIPVKFRFRLNKNHRSFLTRRVAREYYIEGQLQLDLTKLRRYIFHHPPGGFLSLNSQTAHLSEIPISVESSAIRHKATNVTVLTRELTEIVGYLNSLGRTIVEGEVLFWTKHNSCRAVHKFASKNRYIKFLFDIPEPQRGLSIVELQHSFTTVVAGCLLIKKG